MRKFLCCFLIAILCIMPIYAHAEENLVKNGDFSQVSGNFPKNWTIEQWYTETGVSRLYVEENGYDGNSIAIVNMSENDARFAQEIPVKPDTLYRISGMCRAEGCGADAFGANLSVKDLFCYSETLYNTNGEWKPLELYGRTGSDQTTLTIFARVGGYGNLNYGRAWFDNIEVVELDSAPAGAFINDFATPAPTFIEEESSGFGDTETVPSRNTEMFLLLGCIYLFVIFAAVRKYGRGKELTTERYNALFAGLLATAFLVRCYFAITVPGYNTDVNAFTAWSDKMYAEGIASLYSTKDYFCDYPPLYLMLLYPAALLRNLFDLPFRSGAHLLILKMLPMLFDLGGAWLVYRCAKASIGARAALVLSAFFAFNPAAIADSSAWGQIDSVFTLMIALCALYAADEKYGASLICFALAALTKPQSLLFAPLGLFAILVFLVRRAHSGKKFKKHLLRFVYGLLGAFVVLYIFAFISTFDPSRGALQAIVYPARRFIELYKDTMSGYSYITVNTLNLYYLLDLNWRLIADCPGWTFVAWIAFALSYLYSFFLCARTPNRKHLPLIGGMLIVLICTFGPMIHERYVFPALLLLVLGYIHARDKRLLASISVLTFTLFLNIVLVLQGGMTAANYGHLASSENWLNLPLCILNILNALFLARTVFDICVRGRVLPIATLDAESESEAAATGLSAKQDHLLHLKRADVWLMLGVTLVYSVACFTNLGSLKAPQTSWTSSAAGETIVFDLGEVEPFRMTYYGGICNSNFTVELSDDGVQWSKPCYALYNQGEIFRWIWFVPKDAKGNNLPDPDSGFGEDFGAELDETFGDDFGAVETPDVQTRDGAPEFEYAGANGESFPFQTARYVRITAQAAGLVLSEVGFLNADSKPLPIADIQRSDAFNEFATEYKTLIDEQDTIPEYPSYFNSTYFDEIYHARTAYEHLHGMSTYETTHPPLGKVLMMVGIQLFGMTPFGWRFMGALMGVLMLPLMYLLVKQLTKSTKLSFVAMFLFAVDSMHFTQTRIATIDSYSVFWIMLMYLFMFRYCQMNWNEQSLGRTLVPLGLCGMTMGVAWATKWIGIYASAGLAVLLFWTLFVRLREALASGETDENAMFEYWRKAGLTLTFCLVFFVAIPVLIYYLSYFWHLRYYGVTNLFEMFSKENIKRIFDMQKGMFSYHAGLGGDTHYFRSPWYQWPIIWWPMWYFSGTAYMPDGVISSISCMGNPAVWWVGLAALIYVIYKLCALRRAPVTYVFVVIGFASQFLPWVLVPRSTFIYHYFASVPFIILATVLMLHSARSEKRFKIYAGALMIAALLLFVAFYPLESGMPVARSYAQYLRWFSWYNF